MTTRVVRGIPTKLDVDKLIETFGKPRESETIYWSEIEQATGLKKDDYRFKTVVNAWRATIEQDFDILLYPVRGVGIAVADANTKIDIASRKIALNDKSKTKWVERTFKVDTEKLDVTRKETQSRILTIHGAMLKLAAATAPKKLPLPKEWQR